MKKFKEFLENYDFYVDMPMGWNDVDTEDEVEEYSEEDETKE